MRSSRLLVPLALMLLVGGHFVPALAIPEEQAEVDIDPASRHPGDLTAAHEGDEHAVPKHHLGAAKIMGDLDSNHDGKVSREELVARLKQVNKELGCARRARASRRGAAAARAESPVSRLP